MPSEPIFGGTSFINRFSTEALPERDRIAIWREEFGRQVARCDFEALDVHFYADIIQRVAPDVSVMTASHAALRVKRTHEMLADGDSSVVFHVSTCRGVTSQCGKDVDIGSGEAIFVSNSDVGIYTFPESRSTCCVMKLSRDRFGRSAQDLGGALMRKIPAALPALQLLTSYVGAWMEAPALPPELDHAVVNHIYELAGLVIGANRDATENAKQGGVRAAQLQIAKRFVLEHLTDSRLSVEAVAKHLGVTPRYIHMLFETEPVTFSEFVLAERLGRAHRILTDPRTSDRAIGEIAIDVGFGDLSYFNRTFKRRYASTPRDLRAGQRPVDRK